MRNDDHLIFEGYKKKSHLHFGMSEGEYNKMEEEREKTEHKQFKKDYKKAVKSGDLKHKSEDAESLSIHPGDWGDSYQEVKHLIDQLLSYGLDKTILSGILQYAEEVGYTGESVNNLIKLIQHFNEKGVQDS